MRRKNEEKGGEIRQGGGRTTEEKFNMKAGGEGDASIRSSIVCVYTNDGRTDGAYTQGRGGRRCLLVLGISGGKHVLEPGNHFHALWRHAIYFIAVK